ncbi:DUF1127 domain-containing protein [Roseovarius sp. EL26]|uniref:DUF1127 domain-containing protein n=1 Tax=Roseovarius sp. EL26 TaxID=2126672 RepID=UPI000EA172E1|nr:DUF1127 domain-containing protein [Roseovarius sp. EL26]
MELLSRTRTTTCSIPSHPHGFKALMSLYRQRRNLRKLDDASLRDIGLSRHDALTEANRAPWDVPSHWKA